MCITVCVCAHIEEGAAEWPWCSRDGCRTGPTWRKHRGHQVRACVLLLIKTATGKTDGSLAHAAPLSYCLSCIRNTCAGFGSVLQCWDLVRVPHFRWMCVCVFVCVCVCLSTASTCIQQGCVEQTVNTVLWPISASSSGQRRLQKVTHKHSYVHAHTHTHTHTHTQTHTHTKTHTLHIDEVWHNYLIWWPIDNRCLTQDLQSC